MAMASWITDNSIPLAYQFVQFYNKKVCFTNPLFGESTADGWIPLTKEHKKCAESVLMPSPRYASLILLLMRWYHGKRTDPDKWANVLSW